MLRHEADMFVCKPCHTIRYTNDFYPRSYGRCEHCGIVDDCSDVQSGLLQPKTFDEDELDQLLSIASAARRLEALRMFSVPSDNSDAVSALGFMRRALS